MAAKIKPYGVARTKKAIKGKRGKALTSTVGSILKSEGRPKKRRVSTVTVTKSRNKPAQSVMGKSRDRRRVAMPAGKRRATRKAKRKYYYESRKNRSDDLGSV